MRLYARFIGVAVSSLLLSGCPDHSSGPEIPQAVAPSEEQTAYFGSQVTLRNDGPAAANFYLKINDGGPYRNLDDLNRAVLAYPDEYAGEPLYRKAWRFVKDAHTHSVPLYGNESQDYALLYINSVGFGFCSDVATTLDQVWTSLGYPARLWYLSGHVVPSVFADGAWHMLDPDLGVYYLNSNNAIASVPELESNPSLILSPIQMVDGASPTAYSETVGAIYTSADDNFPGRVPYLPQDFTLAWTLPEGASLTLPLPVTRIQTTQGAVPGSQGDAHLARLQIPRGWSGEVNIPLVIYDITGTGTVAATNENGETTIFSIGSKALKDYINARTALSGAAYFYRLKLDATGPVNVSYFINTEIMNLTDMNRIQIQGTNLDGVLID
jgi:hypothetical protein